MKQIRIYDTTSNEMVGGILLDNGDVIFCDTGDYMTNEKFKSQSLFEIQEVYKTWIDLTNEIIGN